MERFWEFIVDTIILLLKVFATFFAIRVLMLVLDTGMYIPYFDDLMFGCLDLLGYYFPTFSINR